MRFSSNLPQFLRCVELLLGLRDGVRGGVHCIHFHLSPSCFDLVSSGQYTGLVEFYLFDFLVCISLICDSILISFLFNVSIRISSVELTERVCFIVSTIISEFIFSSSSFKDSFEIEEMLDIYQTRYKYTELYCLYTMEGFSEIEREPLQINIESAVKLYTTPMISTLL
jgi:hypothetical protein